MNELNNNNLQGNNKITLDISKMSAEQLYIHLVELYQSTHTFMVGNLDLVRGDYYDMRFNELEKLKKENFKLKDELEKAKKREDSYRNDILELKEELNNFKRYYGAYTSPFEVLNNLYAGSGKKEYLDTFSILNPKTKLGFNNKTIDYWLSVFEDLGICQRIDKGRYMAMTNFKQANKILHEFINKNNVKNDII